MREPDEEDEELARAIAVEATERYEHLVAREWLDQMRELVVSELLHTEAGQRILDDLSDGRWRQRRGPRG